MAPPSPRGSPTALCSLIAITTIFDDMDHPFSAGNIVNLMDALPNLRIVDHGSYVAKFTEWGKQCKIFFAVNFVHASRRPDVHAN
ncbi:hypothetical protein BD410DRAFT_85946 [Rickenella mellea]|uniref:Uncharacterized protein n=1 Tax=Rickenella mellea TaxID=50990 RepID=A0A4Y7PKN2_9AGAM|nr:hypothetical protein BD410DRAFT_85946 [Rickenella mellea]